MLSAAPAILQNCWVVPDIDAAMARWLALGHGPFIKYDLTMEGFLYRGKSSPISIKCALCQAGDVQVELIEQINPGPSVYRDMFAPGEGGFHHVLRTTNDFAGDVAKLRAAGIEIAGEMKMGIVEFCYADTRATLGCMLELVSDAAPFRALFKTVRDAALNWDGTDPIRAPRR